MSEAGPEVAAHGGRGLLLRALAGGLLIVGLTAAATATAGLLQVKELGQKITRLGGPHIPSRGITRAEAGAPQTILILGSDRRWQDLKAHNKALTVSNRPHSDTLMLVRLDPDQAATTVLSLPRDLRVAIPGVGIAKINEAYARGGPTLTVQTVKQLTGLEINHVVNVQFRGFREAVDAIGCVYVDVDRRYFHSNKGVPIGQRYAAIDIQPGYQRLCGSDALDYVRFRHADSDIVRAARQQDFLRAAKDQVSTSRLLGKRGTLVDIFASNTQTDKELDSTTGLLRILKLAIFSAGRPVREVQFPATFEQDTLRSGDKVDYVVASQDSIDRTVEQFLHPSKGGGRPKGKLTPKKEKRTRARTGRRTRIAGLVDARGAGRGVAGRIGGGTLPFPVYFPRYVTTTSRYDDPPVRAYTIRDRAGRPRHAYRMVLVANPAEGQYWGVEGTDWRTPPLLEAEHETVHRHGRRLSVYRDGSRIRLVAWRTRHAVYWVSNSLSDALTNSQMLEIASTLTRSSHR